jgi:endoglucanase
MGNLVATKGNANEVFISAHMDEVGFMVTGIQNDGTLRFSQIGGVDPKFLASKTVVIGKSRILGVIGAKPVHLIKNSEKEVGYSDLYIDIGCSSYDEAKDVISIGDPAVFSNDFKKMDCDTEVICGKALDNRLGCFILCKMIEDGFLENGTFLFSVQEETGLRGVTSFLLKNRVQFGIALDTTTANDLPNVTGPDMICCSGFGPVISFADGASVYNRNLIREIFALLNKNNITVQTKRKRTGGNDASAIEKISYGAKSVSVSVPCRYIHGPIGAVRVDDIENTLKALKCIISRIKELDHD